MKKGIIVIILSLLYLPLFATHIKGGELSYTFINYDDATKTITYEITLTLFMDCNSIPQVRDPSASISIFNNDDRSSVRSVTANAISEYTIGFDPNSNRCIGNPPSDVCYLVKEYVTQITVPVNNKGYTLGYQRCCRIIGIRNLQQPSDNYGATYTAEIPGNEVYPGAYINNSPKFENEDATAICVGSKFNFEFNAVDTDSTTDRLVYRLCSGFQGGSPDSPSPSPASFPPFSPLHYSVGYSGSSPLGSQVSIDSLTGIISGVAPNVTGQYVITVCAYEYRDDVLISVHRKDIHVGVSDCIPINATLDPAYPFCEELDITIANKRVNPAGSVYTWDFGDGSPVVRSNHPMGQTTHSYATPGSYNIKMRVEIEGHCEDELTTIANVFPGFEPDFNFQGECIVNPFQFTDATVADHGVVNKWQWDFGDETTQADTSNQRTPVWNYSSIGLKRVKLNVESSVGCIGTIEKDLEVKDRPEIHLPFRDTLICFIDTLQLQMTGNGVANWAPGYNIINANTKTPLVYPKQTTVYNVTLTNFGCENTDSITVRVTDRVILDAGPDTTICLTDSVMFQPTGNGLHYSWGPPELFTDNSIPNATALPIGNTLFRVSATVGKCSATDFINVATVPYPVANAGPDTTICYNTPAFLNASMTASRFTWSPSNRLINPASLSLSTTNLVQTTPFILTVSDVLGCPKEVSDTVLVTVREQIFPFAGNDTIVVAGQPLQLSGSGSLQYNWSPPEAFDNAASQTPIAMLYDDERIIMRTYTPEGCEAYDTIFVKVFKTGPDIFVPNAFTPLGFNPVLKPVAPGLEKLYYFSVYNRWGQLVYTTNQLNQGWDGRIKGQLQDTGSYVWMVSGIDYLGRTITKKGTAVLIR